MIEKYKKAAFCDASRMPKPLLLFICLCHIKWLIFDAISNFELAGSLKYIYCLIKTDILRKFYFFFYVPFRIAGKEPKGRPKERGDCDFSPFLWNPIPIALFVHT